MSGVKDFVAVHDGDEVLCIREVDDIVGVAGEHVDSLDVVAIDLPLEDLAFRIIEVALLDKAMAFDYDELFELGVVPMLALRDAWLGNVDTDLTTVEGMDEFREGTTLIDIHLQRESDFVLREIREIGAVEFLGETVCGYLGNQQGVGLSSERLEKADNLT